MAALARKENTPVKTTSTTRFAGPQIVAWHGGTVEVQIAALLHDVVEDTHVNDAEMVREHFR
ncbi:hypothetical protein OFY05_23385 (plasmid) [Pseudocitrobacter faecalis]|nr:hypothetical protein OFY05_23385 [Pseudocitrobacter faecalis]